VLPKNLKSKTQHHLEWQWKEGKKLKEHLKGKIGRIWLGL
jgi:hypothetical protein